MFLRITRNRRGKNVYEYARIAERYIENGRQKTRTLEYLGPVKNQDDRERYIKALQIYREREAIKAGIPGEFSLLPAMDFGIFHASMHIMREEGILSALKRNAGVYLHIVVFMIVSRLIDPSSDLSLLETQRMVYYPWSDLRLNNDNIYRALDRMISRKESLELDLFHALNPDTSVVHYDLTSSYFEGREDNDLVLFGYSRDKKRGKKQIVIGLVMAGGIPIYHEVWPGNTIDPKTLESTLSVLRERFRITNVIFIGDRAFGRDASLKHLDQNRYITAAYRWDQPYRQVMTGTGFDEADLADNLFMKEVHVDMDDLVDEGTTGEERGLIVKRRHIVVYNSDREKLDLRDMEEKVNAVRKKIGEISDMGDLKKSLGKLKSFVKFTKTGVIVNEKRINTLKGLAGRFMIITNTDLPVREVVNAYKDQWRIERSFRTIKSFLEIRPVYHRKSGRIKAHVFVCVLSLLISRMIEKRSSLTISEASRQLSYLKVTPVRLGSGMVMMSSESDRASSLLKKMGIPYPEKTIKSAQTSLT